MLYMKRLFFIDIKATEIHTILKNLVDMRIDDTNRIINIISQSVPFHKESIELILKSSTGYGIGKLLFIIYDSGDNIFIYIYIMLLIK